MFLTPELFKKFIDSESYMLNAWDKQNNQPVSDAVVLFTIVINQMLQQGKQFSSPGNSKKRNFINWYNSRFSDEDVHHFNIIIKKQHLDLMDKLIQEQNT